MKNKKINQQPPFKTVILHFKKQTPKCKFFWFLSLFFGFISIFFMIITALLLNDLTKTLTNWNSESYKKIIKYCIEILVSIIGTFIFDGIGNVIAFQIDTNIATALKKDLSSKIDNLPIKYFDKNTSGDIGSTIVNDTSNVNDGCLANFSFIIYEFAALISIFVCMFVINWIFAIIVLSCFVFSFFLIFIIMKFSQKYSIAKQNIMGKINSYSKECIENNIIVTTYNKKKEVTNTFNDLNKQIFKNSFLQLFWSSSFRIIMTLINYSTTILIVITAAFLISSHSNSTSIIAMIPTFMVFCGLLGPQCMGLARDFSSIQTSAGSLERIYSILNEEEIKKVDSKEYNLKNIKGNIKFDNICFSYNEDKQIIKNFSLDIKHGQKIAIIGATGSGKTTLINLLMKFYNVDSGKILIDGIDIKDLNQSDIANLFGMVLQDTWLYSDTIKNNIKYMSKISDEKYIDICKLTHIYHFIHTLPKNDNTIITPTVNFSQGQKQLLTIARQIAKNSPMLILDEATSNIDSEYERKIQISMDKMIKGKTSLIIAHRLSTIENADVIVVLKNGEIVEKGNHHELLKKNGEYLKLYNSQFIDD